MWCKHAQKMRRQKMKFMLEVALVRPTKGEVSYTRAQELQPSTKTVISKIQVLLHAGGLRHAQTQHFPST